MMRALAAITVVFAGCTQPPDLAPVAASFAPGTAGLGGARIDAGLADTAFGARVADAVRSQPDLARAEARLRAARAELRGAEGAFLPSASLGAEAELRSRDGEEDSGLSPFLRVSQLVYDGGLAQSETTAAQARVLEARGARLGAASASALRAVEAHVAVRSRRDLLALARSDLKVHEDFLGQIAERVETGAGVQSDLLTVQARAADARTRVADATARLDRALAEYREVFGIAPGDLPPAAPAPALPRDAEEVVAQSPRLRAAEASVAAARAELSAALAQRLPRVEAGATGSRLPGGDPDVALDLQVNYSIDSTGERAAAIEGAQARLDASRSDRDALAREIRRQLEIVRSEQRAGAARLAAAREAAQANERTVAAAREEFTIGRRSLLDLLDAQRDFVASRRTLIAAEDEPLLTGYAALALTGDILDAFGLRVDGGATGTGAEQ